jgi:ATP-dependent DNA helicase RecQ
MTNYCQTNDCLREYILKYFQDKAEKQCGNCSNCLTSFETVDVTEQAQKIMSCILRMGERFGIRVLIDALRGSQSEKILNFKLDQIKTYGIMAEVSTKRIKEIIDYLIIENYIALTNTEYPVTKLTEKSKAVLYANEKLFMKVTNEIENNEQSVKVYNKKAEQVENYQLLVELKKLRVEMSKEQNVSAYVIFADTALVDMCNKMPTSEREFLNVSGVGKHKLEKYGEQFLSVIRQFSKLENKEANKETNDKRTTYTRTNIGMTLSTLIEEINSIIPKETIKSLFSNKSLIKWLETFLIDSGFVQVEIVDNKQYLVPTKYGFDKVIVANARISKDKIEYTQIFYSKEIQQSIIDKINYDVYMLNLA